jgi:hypothetical protein
MAWTFPPNLIGIAAAGDCGDLTMYTDRFGQKVWFPKSPPKDPPSPAQASLRAAFKSAQQSYMALSAAQKKTLEDACRRTSIPMTGQNLWIHTIMKLDKDAYLTIQRQSGLTLPTPYWPEFTKSSVGMGNKFSNRTGTLLRPKVCISPPPPPPPSPPPTVTTPCCPATSLPLTLHGTITAAGCPAMLGLTVTLVSAGGVADPWNGDITIPTVGLRTFSMRCGNIGAGNEWIMNNPTVPPNTFNLQTFSKSVACTPFVATFNLRMQLADLPASCSGSAARNFTLVVTP